MHSISPRIQIDYIDDINELRHGLKVIKSEFGARVPRAEWDTWPRGVGAPPVKTDDGWLVFYHATDKHEPHKYKLGVMLLDLQNPEKILARATQPVLTPDIWYENDSKPGVVYVCGAVIVDGNLYVYYGGGDRHVCVAHMPVQKLLNWLKSRKVAE